MVISRAGRRLRTTVFASAVGIALAAPSIAAPLVQTALPSNTYITLGGLDWAWAFPLPTGLGLSPDLSFQSQFGWRLPTVEELSLAPLATDFIFAGANVPLGGSDPVSGATFQSTNASLTGAAACATPYFSSNLMFCDWNDGSGQPFGPWSRVPGALNTADQLMVRTAVPGPLAGAGLPALLALGGFVWKRRRKAARSAA